MVHDHQTTRVSSNEKVSALLGSPFGPHRRSDGRGPSAARRSPVFAPIPVFTWTGFYVGVNAGYGWGNSDDNTCFGCFGGGVVTVDTTPGGATVAPLALPSGALFQGTNGGGNRDGFVGGAQVGFNYQFTPGSGFVVGVEADIQWLGGDNDTRTTASSAATSSTMLRSHRS